MAQWLNVDFLRNAHLFFNRDLMLPTSVFPDISGIGWENVQASGIKGIIFDADQTLVPYHGVMLHPGLVETFDKVKRVYGADKIAILSNYAGNQMDDRRTKRKQALEANLGVRVISAAKKKPAPEPYHAAMAYLGTTPETTLMVGDRLATDILGARRAGIQRTFLVLNPIDAHNDPWYTSLTRNFERKWYDKEIQIRWLGYLSGKWMQWGSHTGGI
ncbi:YqeG family HAD IIIA-type phosphatase [Candidatus Woesearchaeota archaeon]|nr:YqeG family HAD IIIA-type phosphatase [Candidatus Woesearchaeota archaeon]